MTRDEYTEKVVEILGESDYSSEPALWDITTGTIAAAAHLMHREKADLSEGTAVRALLGFQSYYADDNALACAEEKSFMDKADDLRLGSFRLDDLSKGVSRSVRDRMQREGKYVVELTDNTDGCAGYYIFDKSALGS